MTLGPVARVPSGLPNSTAEMLSRVPAGLPSLRAIALPSVATLSVIRAMAALPFGYQSLGPLPL